MPPRLASVLVVTATTALILTGCSSNHATNAASSSASPTATSSTTSAAPTSSAWESTPSSESTPSGGSSPNTDTPQTTDTNNINYGSSDSTATIDCGNGSALGITGSNSILTVTGTCSSAQIGGDGNKITFDKIENGLAITGNENKIDVKSDNIIPNLNISGNNNDANTGTG